MKNSYLVTIYTGLAKDETIKSIHKKLLDETLKRKKQGMVVNDNMLKIAQKTASKLKKQVDNTRFVLDTVEKTYGLTKQDNSPFELISIFVFDLLDKNKIEKRLSHEITLQADKIEGDTKQKVIEDNLKKNRELENPKIFYLASWHRDSASDHKDYQGKMYIDENWQKVVKNSDLTKRIQTYISTHSVKTVQWVTGKPVWFITRPNCRHYFMELRTDEVLGTSKSNLLEKYNMETAIGDRQYLQTIKHSTSKQWYNEVRNAQLLLEKYKMRLALHKDMYAEMPNVILKNAIKKDLFLIEKWQKYIESKNKVL